MDIFRAERFEENGTRVKTHTRCIPGEPAMTKTDTDIWLILLNEQEVNSHAISELSGIALARARLFALCLFFLSLSWSGW